MSWSLGWRLMASLVFFILLVGLGTARITALVTKDSIFEPLRDLLFHYSPPENNARYGWEYQNLWKASKKDKERGYLQGNWYQRRFIEVEEAEKRKPGWLGTLISCPFCFSVWVAAANLYLSVNYWPFMFWFNVWLVIAFIGSYAVHYGGWK